MGIRCEYYCKKCDKMWVDDLVLFYLMSDDRLEHSGLVMLTSEIARRSVANGRVHETYCRGCDKDIKLYIIDEVKTEYLTFDTTKIIEEYKYDSHKIFGSYDEFKEGTKLKCPSCKNEIELNIEGDLEDEFYLNCNIYRSYCNNCGDQYEFYAIKPLRRDYTKKEAFEKIREIINDEYMLGFDENYLENEINCPFCDKKIPKKNNFDKCPKCDGELEGGVTEFYD